MERTRLVIGVVDIVRLLECFIGMRQIAVAGWEVIDLLIEIVGLIRGRTNISNLSGIYLSYQRKTLIISVVELRSKREVLEVSSNSCGSQQQGQ